MNYKDYYKTLGVAKNATAEDIKKLAGLNLLRVFWEAENVSARLRGNKQ